MSDDAGVGRPSRELRVGGVTVRAVLAWRAPRGEGLCYFLRATPDSTEAGAGDRRAALAADRRLNALEVGELGELWASAAPLTTTERRFRAPDGRAWLAQGRGPVWGGEAVAAGLTGVVFTSLEGPFERRDVTASVPPSLARLAPEALDELWRRAGAEDRKEADAAESAAAEREAPGDRPQT